MQRFEDVEGKLFNVIVTRMVPVFGGTEPYSEQANHQPVDWDRACIWLRGMMAGIGKEWAESRYVDCYIELAECPRPWTQEIKSAFDREQLRCSIESDPCYLRQVTKRDFAQAALSQIIGSEGATQVIQGTYQGGSYE